MQLIKLFKYFTFASLAMGRCPPSGPVLPPPYVPASTNTSNLTTILDNLSHNDTASGWNISSTSFSIDVTALDSTFFSYHYTAPLRNLSGTHIVNSDTIFRVASVTKVFTVLATLMEDRISQADPITKFLPELKGGKWADVTIELLMNQISGAPRDCNC